MECLSKNECLSDEERVRRFSEFLSGVVGVDDLFPPDGGVREPVRNPENIGPKVGTAALELVWSNPEPVDNRHLYLVS